MPAESKEPKYCYGLGFGHLSNVVEQLCKQLPTILNFTVDSKLTLSVINKQHIQVIDKSHVLFLGLLLAKKTIKLLLKAKGFAKQGKNSLFDYVLNKSRSVVDLGSLGMQARFWPDYINVLKQSFRLDAKADLKQLYLPIKNHLQQSFDFLKCVPIINLHVSNKNLHKNIHYLSMFLISKIPELILVVANNDVKNINSHSVSKYSLSDVDPKEGTIRSDLLCSLSLLDTLQGNILQKIQIISESEQIFHLVEKFYCIINLIYPWDLIAQLEKFLMSQSYQESDKDLMKQVLHFIRAFYLHFPDNLFDEFKQLSQVLIKNFSHKSFNNSSDIYNLGFLILNIMQHVELHLKYFLPIFKKLIGEKSGVVEQNLNAFSRSVALFKTLLYQSKSQTWFTSCIIETPYKVFKGNCIQFLEQCDHQELVRLSYFLLINDSNVTSTNYSYKELEKMEINPEKQELNVVANRISLCEMMGDTIKENIISGGIIINSRRALLSLAYCKQKAISVRFRVDPALIPCIRKYLEYRQKCLQFTRYYPLIVNVSVNTQGELVPIESFMLAGHSLHELIPAASKILLSQGFFVDFFKNWLKSKSLAELIEVLKSSYLDVKRLYTSSEADLLVLNLLVSIDNNLPESKRFLPSNPEYALVCYQLDSLPNDRKVYKIIAEYLGPIESGVCVDYIPVTKPSFTSKQDSSCETQGSLCSPKQVNRFKIDWRYSLAWSATLVVSAISISLIATSWLIPIISWLLVALAVSSMLIIAYNRRLTNRSLWFRCLVFVGSYYFIVSKILSVFVWNYFSAIAIISMLSLIAGLMVKFMLGEFDLSKACYSVFGILAGVGIGYFPKFLGSFEFVAIILVSGLLLQLIQHKKHIMRFILTAISLVVGLYLSAKYIVFTQALSPNILMLLVLLAIISLNQWGLLLVDNKGSKGVANKYHKWALAIQFISLASLAVFSSWIVVSQYSLLANTFVGSIVVASYMYFASGYMQSDKSLNPLNNYIVLFVNVATVLFLLIFIGKFNFVGLLATSIGHAILGLILLVIAPALLAWLVDNSALFFRILFCIIAIALLIAITPVFAVIALVAYGLIADFNIQQEFDEICSKRFFCSIKEVFNYKSSIPANKAVKHPPEQAIAAIVLI